MKMPNIDQGKAVEAAVRFQDIRERAARVRPVSATPERLDRPISIRDNLL